MSEEVQAPEPEPIDFENGPLSVLTRCVKNKFQILIHGRNNKKILGNVLAFDKHCNMLLNNVKEMWQEIPKLGKGKKGKPLSKDRSINTLFVRGDTVIIVLPNPGSNVE